MRYFIFCCIYVFVAQGAFAEIAPEPAGNFADNKLVSAKDYMVVAANPQAVAAGREVIEAGGNAIDAAIAVQMVLNVVEPQSSGIGGGGFLLYYDASNKQITSFDGRETAPKLIDPAIFIKENGEKEDFFNAVQGGRSVGVPGLLAMLRQSHSKYGKLEWHKLFQPAIAKASSGFALSSRLHKVLSSVSYLNKFADASAMFLDADGNVKEVGTVIYNNQLADILKVIAKDKAASFYKGGFAVDIASTVANAPINPGSLRVADMAGYKAKQREVVCAPYRSYKVCGMGPPSSGGIAIAQALGVLQNFDLSQDRIKASHLVAGATKLVFADRNKYVADSDFANVPLSEMLDEQYLQHRAGLLDKNMAKGIFDPGDLSDEYAYFDNGAETPSTTHISIVDKQGNAVSLTSSIEHAFGSVLMSHGFFLNNQLTDFAFRPRVDGKPVANNVQGNKRPRSSMSPTIILDANDELFMVIGSPGGSSIIPYVLKTIIAVIDWQMDIQQAIDLPHFVNKNSKHTYIEESLFPEEDAYKLKQMGHKLEYRPLNSGLHGIVIKDGVIQGGADPRREGMALGG